MCWNVVRELLMQEQLHFTSLRVVGLEAEDGLARSHLGIHLDDNLPRLLGNLRSFMQSHERTFWCVPR